MENRLHLGVGAKPYRVCLPSRGVRCLVFEARSFHRFVDQLDAFGLLSWYLGQARPKCVSYPESSEIYSTYGGWQLAVNAIIAVSHDKLPIKINTKKDEIKVINGVVIKHLDSLS